MMKGKGLLIAALSAAMFVPAVGTSTSAATWHSGAPSALRGNWQGSKHAGGRYSTLSISKSKFTYHSWETPDPGSASKLQYKKSGSTYTITGRQYDNAPASGYKETYKIKVYSHSKIYLKSNAYGINGYYYK